jgi:hypothetical protein
MVEVVVEELRVGEHRIPECAHRQDNAEMDQLMLMLRHLRPVSVNANPASATVRYSSL